MRFSSTRIPAAAAIGCMRSDVPATHETLRRIYQRAARVTKELEPVAEIWSIAVSSPAADIEPSVFGH